MSTAISRMQFLRGDFSGDAAPLRPPWALPESVFMRRCEPCGECIARCPTHIIRRGRGDYPIVDFSAGECLFCAECVNACRPGALKKNPDAKPWTLHAVINPSRCLAHRNVECRSCFDPCEARAIRMQPRIGGVAIPVLEHTTCTGCGACFGICPVQAIDMSSKPLQVTA